MAVEVARVEVAVQVRVQVAVQVRVQVAVRVQVRVRVQVGVGVMAAVLRLFASATCVFVSQLLQMTCGHLQTSTRHSFTSWRTTSERPQQT